MSTFTDLTLEFKNQIEQANIAKIKNHGKNIENRPMTIEEIMKQRDADVYLRHEDYITEESGSMSMAVNAQFENFVKMAVRVGPSECPANRRKSEARIPNSVSGVQLVTRRVSLCTSLVLCLCIPLYLATTSLIGTERTPFG